MTKVYPLSAHFGKVRNSVVLSNKQRILETTDRVSAFDVILPFTVPEKGETLQALSLWFFQQTKHIVPNHIIGSLSKNQILVHDAQVIPVEFVMRGVLTGSLWRLYHTKGAAFVNKIYGVDLPEGLVKNCRLPQPILTPTTKARSGHDEPITTKMIFPVLVNQLNNETLAQKILDEVLRVCFELFQFGQELATARGLELVDTKFEFGMSDSKLILVDEVLTPDSSRYWLMENDNRQEPKQLSKEVLREKLVEKYGDPEQFESSFLHTKQGIDAEFARDVTISLQSRYHEMFRYFVPKDSPLQVSQKHLVTWPVPQESFQMVVDNLRLPSCILIVGNGGRDWSIFDFFAQLPEVQTVYCSPGQRLWHGSKYKECPHTSPQEIANFAAEHAVELVISGPETPLAEGLWEACHERGIPCLGPDLSGVTLETSKVICKELLRRAKAPTADSITLPWKELENSLEKNAPSLLNTALKFDGLAAGKGVVVCQNSDDLHTALLHFRANIKKWTEQTLAQKADSATKQNQQPMFLVEQMLGGDEVSVIALCNGAEYRLLPVARDYKRRNNEQKGPNTGGMGSACPVALTTKTLNQVRTIFEKTLNARIAEGKPYSGFLFAGLIIDPNTENAQVIEFNCRLGDPEAQVILPGLSRDFCVELYRTARGLPFVFPNLQGQFFEHDGLSRVFVVAASPEYPGETIARRSVVSDSTSEAVFIPSAVEKNGTTMGGRAFGYLGTGHNFADARAVAYQGIKGSYLKEENKILSPHYRTDVAEELVAFSTIANAP